MRMQQNAAVARPPMGPGAANIALFTDLYPVEAAWLRDNEENDFSRSLLHRIRNGWDLSQNQWTALRRAATPRPRPVCDVSRIETAFAQAKARGVKRPKLRLDTFIFSASGPASAYAGAVFVREGDVYLGKVIDGRFLATRGCDEPTRDRILAAVADPQAAAVAYGQRTGACSVCGRPLIVTESVDLGIGPVCRARFFGLLTDKVDE